MYKNKHLQAGDSDMGGVCCKFVAAAIMSYAGSGAQHLRYKSPILNHMVGSTPMLFMTRCRMNVAACCAEAAAR